MTHPDETTAVSVLSAIRERGVSAQDLISCFLARIERENPRIFALRHVAAEAALDAARALDARIRAGGSLPPLAGLPVVVKENCDTAGSPCSAGLSFRENRVPSADSWITTRLRTTGAIVLGVSVSDPGAFSVRTADVTHPLDTSLTVGGSSGGSAAALAAGFCLGAIGTDTGGSIRVPSACCGTVGLKPSYGALPMDGIFPLVKSLDHVGPMARTVEDVRLLWRALAGAKSGPSLTSRRVGYDPAWVEAVDEPIRAAFGIALERLKHRGIVPTEVKLPDLDDAVAGHGRIFLVEAAAYHRAHHGDVIDAYPPIAREWFAIADTMSVGAYVDACIQRAAMTRSVEELLTTVDAIITPTLCVARPQRNAATVFVGNAEQDFTMGLVRLTCLFNHTGHPAIAFPVPDAPDTPLASSVQIVGPHGREERILDLARMIQTISI